MPGELLHSRFRGQTLAALREAGTTLELHHRRGSERGSVGDVIRGRVTRIVPGIDAAFVDIGQEHDAILPARELLLPGEDPEAPAPPLGDRLRVGRELTLQVTRETAASKGVRLSCRVSLAGRLLVHLPLERRRVVSKRIEDPAERTRLEGIVARMQPPSTGFVVRSAGEGVDENAFVAEAGALAESWKGIEERASRARAPAPLHQAEDLLLRLLRDAPRGGFELVVVDDAQDRERAVSFLRGSDPLLASRVRVHVGPSSLLATYGLDRELAQALRPQVWLPSGASVVIEQTEALVAVDVNSGRQKGASRPEESALRTNLEAAAEIARQLRLRDLGGIVVVDFIDMERAENRQALLDAFTSALGKDPARTRVLGMSELGLVELTRQRRRRDLASSLTTPCSACSGRGRAILHEPF